MVVRDFYLSRSNMIDFLAGLQESEKGLTLYLPPGLSADGVLAQLRPIFGDTVPARLTAAATGSRTGACLFWGPARLLILPPFPVVDGGIHTGYVSGPLVTMLRQETTIALVLVRLGAYALGVCRGDTLIASKVGTGLVHGRHRQGGSSSKRFQRRRENQIDQFLNRVCERAQEHLGPHLNRLDHAVYGGAWTTIELLLKQCPVLRALQERALPPLLDIPRPGQQVLEATVRRIWSSHVFEWTEEDRPELPRGRPGSSQPFAFPR